MTSSPNREIGSELIGSLNQSTGSYDLAFGAVLAGLAGFGLDTLFGTRPILTIVCAALGLVGAVSSLVYRYQDRMSAVSAARDDRRTGVAGGAS